MHAMSGIDALYRFLAAGTDIYQLRRLLQNFACNPPSLVRCSKETMSNARLLSQGKGASSAA